MIGKSIYVRDRAAFTGGSPQAVYEELWAEGRRERLRMRGIFAGIALLLGAKLVSIAFGIALALFVAGLDVAHHWWRRACARTWRRGLRGEQRMNRILRFTLERRGHRVLHARVVPGHGKVDQVVIGPSGVWLIDNQAWPPDTDIEEYGGKLFINGKPQRAMTDKLHNKAITVADLLYQRLQFDVLTASVVAVHGGKLRRGITANGIPLLKALHLPLWIHRQKYTPYTAEQIDLITRTAVRLMPIGKC